MERLAAGALIIANRTARFIAEAWSEHAKPGSPVAQAGGDIADEGPEVAAARRTGARTLEVDVDHDGASRFAALDADAARAWAGRCATAPATASAPWVPRSWTATRCT